MVPPENVLSRRIILAQEFIPKLITQCRLFPNPVVIKAIGLEPRRVILNINEHAIRCEKTLGVMGETGVRTAVEF